MLIFGERECGAGGGCWILQLQSKFILKRLKFYTVVVLRKIAES